MKTEPTLLYICNKKRCDGCNRKCSSPLCNFTTDILSRKHIDQKHKGANFEDTLYNIAEDLVVGNDVDRFELADNILTARNMLLCWQYYYGEEED